MNNIYPLDALREGILNSFIHRDYSSTSSSASIIVYAEKLEIINSGQLPLTPGELTRNHLSMPFNPDIAQMAFLRGYIEKIGRGTLKIIEACKQAKMKPPQWVPESNSVKLIFFSNTKLEGVTKGVSKGVTKSVNMKKIEGVIEGVTEGVTEGVRNKLIYLLAAIASNEGEKIPVYAEITEVPQKTIENYIKQLRDAGLIEFKGDPRSGGYIISEKIKRKIK